MDPPEDTDLQVKKRRILANNAAISAISERRKLQLETAAFKSQFKKPYVVVIDEQKYACYINLLDEKFFPSNNNDVTSMAKRKDAKEGDILRFMWSKHVVEAVIKDMASEKSEIEEKLRNILQQLNDESIAAEHQPDLQDGLNGSIDSDDNGYVNNSLYTLQEDIEIESRNLKQRQPIISQGLSKNITEVATIQDNQIKIMELLKELLENTANLNKTIKLIKADQESLNRKLARVEKGLKSRVNETLLVNDPQYVIYFKEKITYRDVDITDDLNAMLKSCDNFSHVVHGFARMLWGDRNLRFWRVNHQNHEASAICLTDLDQLTFGKKPKRGRVRLLNNKDPDGVKLFKKTVTTYFDMRIRPQLVSQIPDDTEQKATIIAESKNMLTRAFTKLNQWGTDSRNRESRSDDCLYWQLLDAGKRPCPNWKPEWEQIENERSLEEDDKFKAPSKFAHNEISKTLREIRSLDTYYDIENEESTLLLHDN